MIESSDDLWQELSVMADSFADLGRRLLHASRELVSPGVVPDAELLEQVGQLRSGFESLRERTYRSASELDLALPPRETVQSLKRLATLLEAVEDAETRNQVAMAEVETALEVATAPIESVPEPIAAIDEIGDAAAQEALPEPIATIAIGEEVDDDPVPAPVAELEVPQPSTAVDEDSDLATSRPHLIAEPEPAFAELTSDALLTDVVAEALPYIPRSQTVRVSSRALGRAARPLAALGLRLFEPLRLLSGGSMIAELAAEAGNSRAREAEDTSIDRVEDRTDQNEAAALIAASKVAS
jgi:hypothetical protein